MGSSMKLDSVIRPWSQVQELRSLTISLQTFQASPRYQWQFQQLGCNLRPFVPTLTVTKKLSRLRARFLLLASRRRSPGVRAFRSLKAATGVRAGNALSAHEAAARAA